MKSPGLATMTLNRQWLAPLSLTARSSSGEKNWNDIEQLLNEAEMIISDLQVDRDRWKQRALDLETINRDLKKAAEKERLKRGLWIGTGVAAIVVMTVVIIVTKVQ